MNDERDRGSVLILILVLTVISAMVVIPIMSYTVTVMRAGDVQLRKARSIEDARGAALVAMRDADTLYSNCNGALPSSIAGVSSTCEVLDTANLHPASDVPYSVAVVQADATLPAGIGGSQSYINPNTAAAWSQSADRGDFTYDSTQAKVWVPEMPTAVVADGDVTRTTLAAGGCDVFFPGTYDQPVTISGPAYFTSGVYTFLNTVTLTAGADVVVGMGAEEGCTDDFAATGNGGALVIPDPLNISGMGGTFVLAGMGRLVIDQAANGSAVRFVMNQRYVGEGELGAAASAGVSIVSANGQHEPFLPGEAYDQPLSVRGVIAVPASQVDDPIDDPDQPGDDPYAHAAGYTPSVLTPKPRIAQPTATGYRTSAATSGAVGAATITWTAPNNVNAAPITGYAVTTYQNGVATAATCGAPPLPVFNPPTPRTVLPTSCTVTGLTIGMPYTFAVTASNAAGAFAASLQSAPLTVLATTSQWAQAQPPLNAVPPTTWPRYLATDGTISLIAGWSPPNGANADGGTPVLYYTVTATRNLGATGHASTSSARRGTSRAVSSTVLGRRHGTTSRSPPSRSGVSASHAATRTTPSSHVTPSRLRSACQGPRRSHSRPR